MADSPCAVAGALRDHESFGLVGKSKRGDLGSTPVLFDSPEGLPSASSTVAEAASPAPLADARVLPVSVVAEAGALRGPRIGPRLCARGPPFLGWPSSC